MVEQYYRIHRNRAGTARERPSRSTRGGQTFARLEEKTKRISHLVGDGFALRLLASLKARGDGRQLRAAVAGVYRHLDGDGARGRGHGRSVWWVPARVRSDRWRAGTFEVDTAVDIEITKKFCLRQDIYPIYGYDREASASSASSCLSHIALYSSSDITSLSLRAVSIASGLARTL